MDVDLFSEYFNKSPVLYLEGRQHPIQIYYTKQAQSDYLQAALVSVFQIHQVLLNRPSSREKNSCFIVVVAYRRLSSSFCVVFLLRKTILFIFYLISHVESAVFFNLNQL